MLLLLLLLFAPNYTFLGTETPFKTKHLRAHRQLQHDQARERAQCLYYSRIVNVVFRITCAELDGELVELGSGFYGNVYKGYFTKDDGSKLPVAIKVLKSKMKNL